MDRANPSSWPGRLAERAPELVEFAGNRRRRPSRPSVGPRRTPGRVPARWRIRPRRPVAAPGRRGTAPNSGRGRRIGGQVEERRQDLRSGHSVDDGVVDLGHDGDPAVRHALHHVELPQRPGPVERTRGQVGHQVGELLGPARTPGVPSAGRGSRGRSRGPPPASGAAARTAPRRGARRNGGTSGTRSCDQRADPPEAEAAGHAGRVEHHRAQDVEMGGGRLQGEEGPVESGQAAHAVTDRSTRTRRGRARTGPACRPRRIVPTPPAGSPAGRSGRPVGPGRAPRGRY